MIFDDEEHTASVTLFYAKANRSREYKVIAKQLTKDDKECKNRDVDVQDVFVVFRHSGLSSVIDMLRDKYVNFKEVWPLLFVQFEHENWLPLVREKLIALSSRVNYFST